MRKCHVAQRANEPVAKKATEGMLVVRSTGGSRAASPLALQAARVEDYASLAPASGEKSQCWCFDRDRRLVPMGHSLRASKAARAESGAGKEKLALDVEGEAPDDGNPVLLWTVGDGANQKWAMGPDGALSTEVGGERMCLGHDGAEKPAAGAKVVMVKASSPKKLLWKWVAEVPTK